jgi:hypothetical protein
MAAPSLFNRNGRPQRRRFDLAFVLAVVAAFGLCSVEPGSSGSNHSGGLVPSRLTARSSVTRHFEYIFDAGGIQVYDIDHRNRYLGQIAFRSLPIRGLVADPATAALFVAYGGRRLCGYLADARLRSGLRKDALAARLPNRFHNIAITPNGRKI